MTRRGRLLVGAGVIVLALGALIMTGVRQSVVYFVTPSELMAVARFDRETYTKLAPYITALPIGTKINVNTASDVVLSSLSDDIDLSTAQSLVEERNGGAFHDIGATFSGMVEPDMLKRIDGTTQYFLLTATITLGTNQLTMRSVLQRDASGLTRPVFRNLGVE